MSFGKKVAAFIVGSIFFLATTSAIMSYVFKDSLKKESISDFIQNNLLSTVIQNQCESQCQQILGSQSGFEYETCLNLCVEEGQSRTGNLDQYVDQVYSQGVAGLSLGFFSDFLNQYFLVLIVIAVVSAVGLGYLADNPFSAFGHNFVMMSLSFIVTGLLPKFITLPPELGVFQVLISYFAEPLDLLLKIGIVLLVLGVVCYIASYYNKKKQRKTAKQRIVYKPSKRTLKRIYSRGYRAGRKRK